MTLTGASANLRTSLLVLLSDSMLLSRLLPRPEEKDDDDDVDVYASGCTVDEDVEEDELRNED